MLFGLYDPIVTWGYGSDDRNPPHPMFWVCGVIPSVGAWARTQRGPRAERMLAAMAVGATLARGLGVEREVPSIAGSAGARPVLSPHEVVRPVPGRVGVCRVQGEVWTGPVAALRGEAPVVATLRAEGRLVAGDVEGSNQGGGPCR